MTANYERRSRLMGFKIRQESWNLEELKKRNRVAQEAVTQAEEALHEIETAIGDTENAMRCILMEQTNLDVERIEAVRRFLANQQGLRKQRHKKRQRVIQKAFQAENQLKQSALYVKALEQIKSTADKEIIRIRENRTAEQLAELWHQRFGRQ